MKYKDLLLMLALRDIQVKYKQSIIGIAWAVLTPLIMTGIFIVIFSHFLKVGSEGVPYPIFAYAAVAPWTLLSNSLPRATDSIETNVALMRKIWFPRYLLPLSAILAALLDFGIACVVLAGMMVYYGVDINWFMLLLPFLFVVQVALIFGISLITSTANAYYRDAKMLVPLVVSVWFYASPIFYSVEAVTGWWRHIYILNPMVGLLDGYRAILVRGECPNLEWFGISLGVTMLILAVGLLFFRRMEKSLVDVI